MYIRLSMARDWKPILRSDGKLAIAERFAIANTEISRLIKVIHSLGLLQERGIDAASIDESAGAIA
jgi:hypothetical protein